tara:strand:- start:898 stop:1251 length:354 start_codon:yes stop_codon:yes gene_type:complete
MTVVNKVDKKVKVTLEKVIKYQIVTYCFMNDIQISASDLNCLTELAKLKATSLTGFCLVISEKGIFKSSQSCRNAVQKAKKKQLIIRNNKKIMLNPIMKIQSEGHIYLDFKILGSGE